jgi:hypothetical protein
VSGGEDASRVRNRNAILVLGLLRRSAVGIYYPWRRHRLACATITARRN